MRQINNLHQSRTNDETGWLNWGVNLVILALTVDIVFLNMRNVQLNAQNVRLNRKNVINNEKSAQSGKETLEIIKQINSKIK